MKEKHVFFLLLLLVTPLPVVAQDAPKTATAMESKPSLDSLVARIDDYWRLLLENKKSQASAYVSPSYIENFSARTIPPFSDPRLSSITLSDDRTEAIVTVTVKRTFPNLGTTMDWPVKERWAFSEGCWYLQSAPISLPVQAGARWPTPLDGEQLEKQQQELRDMVRFEKYVLDLGTIRQGGRAPVSLKYSMTGTEPLPVTFEKFPPDWGILGLSDQKLVPGESRELTFRVPTWKYEGDVNQSLMLIVHRGGVAVPFEFTLRGYVYVPVSLIPKILRFRRGEDEKEILVRNNSKSVLELKSIYSETGSIVLEPLPATILPGQELQLKVKWIVKTANRNTQDNLALSFAHPVDGMASLSLTAILNYVETGTKR